MSDDIILAIENFHSLEDYTKASSLKFRDAVIAYYKKLGEENGFCVRENFSIIKNGANFGKLELLWLEPNIVFTTEFGNIEEIYKHLWKIMEYSPKLAVLVLSSKAGCKAEEVAKIIEKSNITKDKKNIFLLMDITERRIIRLS